jgi:chitin disaccharide deacetylase
MTLSVLIINADDFGYSLTINQAILRSFERNLINSTSLMANMAGFDDAINMVRRHAVLEGKVGIHLNLTEGYPVTRHLRGLPVFCDDSGRLIYDRHRAMIHLGRKEKEGLYGELKGQVERVLSAGIRPTHLDSHHHVHTEWAIAPLVCRLAREYGIRRIRLTRNMGAVGHYAKRIYKRIYNGWWLGRYSGFANTDYFGDIADMSYHAKMDGRGRIMLPPGRSYEVMVHPLFDDRANLVDLNGEDLEHRLWPILGSVADLTLDTPSLK